jgi:molybdopterin-containing oxidoreductase family membrane subunit
MAQRPGGILAIFRYLDELTDAMEKARSRGDFAGHEVFSPTSYHEIEEAGDFGTSNVRWFTLVGALLGCATGFGLAFYIDWDWPLIVGGKTPGVASLPAFVVAGFELTILFGGIATIIGILWTCRIPNPHQRVLDPRFSDDRFGIFVPNARLDGEQARVLKDAGAEELRAIVAG